MALTYLKIFADMEETLALYSDEERGRLLSAMMAYSFRGEEPEFTGAERFVWPMLRNHIDSCEAQSEKQKANGKRNVKVESQTEPNEANESQIKPIEAKSSQTEPIQEQEQDHEQEHVHDQEHKSTRGKRARFVPPTVEEVRAYCEERNNGIDAEEFVNHYETSRWMRGKTPIQDWRACVRTWEQKRQTYPNRVNVRVVPTQPNPPGTTNPFLQMLQEEGYST